jgi:hypothetical protein
LFSIIFSAIIELFLDLGLFVSTYDTLGQSKLNLVLFVIRNTCRTCLTIVESVLLGDQDIFEELLELLGAFVILISQFKD